MTTHAKPEPSSHVILNRKYCFVCVIRFISETKAKITYKSRNDLQLCVYSQIERCKNMVMLLSYVETLAVRCHLFSCLIVFSFDFPLSLIAQICFFFFFFVFTGTGFTRPYQLSPQLAAVVGDDCLPRHEVVKRVWAIINERNLYDPKNKQFAICDTQLQTVMGVKRFRTFAMLKYLKSHFLG